MPEELESSLLGQNQEEVITEGSDYVHKSINKDLHENLEEDNYITRYKREKDIAQKLNQYYYNSDEGGFWGGMNGFYDEGSTIFAKSAWESKIFKLEEGKLVETDRTYRDIAKVGDFYMGVTVETTKDRSSGRDIKKDGSEKYTLLNKEGKEEHALRGSLTFLDKEKLYIEHFSQENKKYYCVYDSNLKKIADNIPAEIGFLFHKDGKLLFVNNSKSDDKRFSIINQGDNRGADYKTKDDPEVANIYEEYMKHNLSPEKINQDAGYAISYKENTRSVEKIIDKESNIIFEADGYMYKIAHQDSAEGIFLLNGIEDTTYIKDIFINAKTGVKLEFHDMPSSTYINGKVLKHFINNNDSELYNIDTGEKLGKSSSYRDNENDIQIIEAENGKSKLVENKTGTIIEQDFDTILKMYDDNTKKHFIVENNGSIIDLHINK